MKIGICIDPLVTFSWPSRPFDFIEANTQSLFVPESADTDFDAKVSELGSRRHDILASNCFLPGDLKVSGPSIDRDRLARYADTAFRRAAFTGAKNIVFGSGGARQIPDGWSHALAFEQFIDALKTCAPLAQKHGVTLLVEPLNRAECNLVNTVMEGAVAVARANHPNIRLLVDFFHMLRNGESPDDIIKVGPWIAHAHIAEKEDRTAPGVKGDDFRPFLAALKYAGYTGTLSVECQFGLDAHAESVVAIDAVRKQLGS